MDFVSFGVSPILLNAADSKEIARAVLLTQRIGHKNFWTKRKGFPFALKPATIWRLASFDHTVGRIGPRRRWSGSSKFRRKQKMIRRFPLVTIAAATLALSLTASASMAGDGQ